MCQSVYLTDKKFHVTSVRGLSDKMGIDPVNLVWHDGPISAGDPWKVNFEYCLCPIDVEASLKHCGYAGEWGKGGCDPMCFVASPMSNGDRA